MARVNRREFLKQALAIGAGACSINQLAPLISVMGGKSYGAASANDLVLLKNGTPASMVHQAIDALGGMAQFVKKGQQVVVKPNIGWDRRPEQAANTNPEIVAEIVRLCLQAGASQVTVFDRTCAVANRAYKNSGIEEAADAAGAKVRHIIPTKFKAVAIPQGQILKSWEFYEDLLKADVFINVPIAKHHSLSRVSLSLKNVMGVLGGDRGALHHNFPEKICDVNLAVKPQLIILDAIRILTRNGPQGGNLADVKTLNTIIAGVNPVAVDALGATLFGLKPTDLDFLRIAQQRGLGEIDLSKLKIKEIAM
ncbi:DUF362 domain-containing protein [candidate division KSB1 bacterium]|nr:DUF362 domain-containing protein [candidate division KSB1 bacterium]